MRLSEMKQKEVINIKDCSRLGFVGDVDIDICTGRVTALIIPGPGCLWGFLGRESEYVIPWRDVKQGTILFWWSCAKRSKKAENSLHIFRQYVKIRTIYHTGGKECEMPIL